MRRQSVRTFNGLRPDKAVMGRLRTFAKEATTPRKGDPAFLRQAHGPEITVTEGTIEEKGEKLGAYGMVKGARCFAMAAGGGEPVDLLAIGFAFERFILMCTSAGLGSCWLGATFTKGRFQRYYEAHCSDEGRGLEVRVVSPLGHQAPKARWGEKMMRWMAKSDRRKSFTELFAGIPAPPEGMDKRVMRGEIRLTELSDIQLTAFGLEMMRLAPSSTNSQPWRAEVCEQGGRITAKVRGEGNPKKGFLMVDMGIGLFHLTETLRAGGRRYECTVKISEKGLEAEIIVTEREK